MFLQLNGMPGSRPGKYRKCPGRLYERGFELVMLSAVERDRSLMYGLLQEHDEDNTAILQCYSCSIIIMVVIDWTVKTGRLDTV